MDEVLKDIKGKQIVKAFICGPPALNYEGPLKLEPVLGKDRVHLV
jgi:hypothetical protein